MSIDIEDVSVIELKAVKLINWYRFANTSIIPYGQLTLIIADNKVGKSALLDAIRYGIFGDTSFNPASETGRDRTLGGYVRGLINKDENTYLRPYPDVYCHIAIEFHHAIDGDFVLETMIHVQASSAGNEYHTVSRYIIRDKKIEDIEDILISKEGVPATEKELTRAFGKKARGIEEFFNAVGLRFSDNQIKDFNAKLRKIIAYKPTKNVSDFIRENVLEKKPADLEGLFKRKDAIAKFRNDYKMLIDEAKQINDIQRNKALVENIENRLLRDRMLSEYIKAEKLKADIKNAQDGIAEAQNIKEQKRREKDAVEDEQRKQREIVFAARESMSGSDAIINQLSEEIKATEKELTSVKSHVQEIAGFQHSLESFQDTYDDFGNLPHANIFNKLLDKDIAEEPKRIAIDEIKRFVNTKMEYLATSKHNETQQLLQKQNELGAVERQLNDYTKNRVNYDFVKDCKHMCDLINEEIAKRHLSGHAKLAFEYVSSITDETWRNSLETFLGRHHFTVLVSEECLDVAMDVFKKESNSKVHIFNTKLLMQKDITVSDDAVSHMLKIGDPTARKYFDYYLGRLHAVDASDKDIFLKYENFITSEGLVSVNMDTYFLDFKRIKMFCLGEESIKRNKDMALQKKAALQKDIIDIENAMNDIENKYDALDEWRTINIYPLKLGALTKSDALNERLASLNSELNKMLVARQDDAEYMELLNIATRAESRIKELDERLKTIEDDSCNAHIALLHKQNDENNAKERLRSVSIALEELINGNTDTYNSMLKIYNSRIGKGEDPAEDKLERESYSRREREMRSLNEKTIPSLLHEYGAKFGNVQITPAVSYEDIFINLEARLRTIDQEDNPRVLEEIRRQEHQYEEEFKNSFILKIYYNCKAGKDEINKLNRQLKSLQFKESYQFSTIRVDDSDYGKIMEYASYLKNREALYGKNDNPEQMTLDVGQTYTDERAAELEKEINTIIDSLLDTKDISRIEELSDYRNYMTYTLKYDDPEKGLVDFETNIAKMGSGAEVQIPYNLVLISALISLYDRPQCARLMFMVEPFIKMSPVNIKIMMDFLREQKLQCIFCAPDKMDSIGEKCDTLIALGKNERTGTVVPVDAKKMGVSVGYATIKNQ